jgi:polyisoprenoid-binding protein YceI
MKNTFFLISAFLIINSVSSQVRYFSKTASVSFYSKALFEDIEAHNNTAICALDATSGKIELSVPIKGFAFENSLMQEHFNENYLESDKFPKAAFRGSMPAISTIDLSKDGIYKVALTGSLYIHGVSKDIGTDAIFTVKGGVVAATAEFVIKPEDYDIKIPALVRDKIAKLLYKFRCKRKYKYEEIIISRSVIDDMFSTDGSGNRNVKRHGR